MQSTVLLTGLDTLVLMVPFAAILLMGMLGLDGQLAAPKRNRRGRRYFCELGGDGRMEFPDPDGRASNGVQSRFYVEMDQVPGSRALPLDSVRPIPLTCSSQKGLPPFRNRWTLGIYNPENTQKNVDLTRGSL